MSIQTPHQAPTSPTPVAYDRRPNGARHTFTETKSGFKTTEFFVMVLFVAGVLLSTYADSDTLSRERGWFIAAIVVAAYVISRGLAKLATREPYVEERDR